MDEMHKTRSVYLIAVLSSKIGALNLVNYEPKVIGIRPGGKAG